MKVNKEHKDGTLMLAVTAEFSELSKFLERAAQELSKGKTVSGFRPGKAPVDVLRRELGDLTLLEEAAKQLIYKEADAIIDKEAEGAIVVGRPNIQITKLAWDNEVEFKIEVDLLPTVKLANYKDRQLKLDSIAVEEDEIAKVLTQLSDSRVKEVLVDRAAQDGDKAVIDIKMFLDDVPLDGGQAKGTAVILGKNQVIPGFDKEIVGLKTEETKDFKLPYPNDHHQKNLAGKRVDFSVKVTGVFERQLPELNDEFAKSFGVANLESLKKEIRENLEHEKLHRAEEKAEGELIEALINESEFGAVSENLIANELELMLRELKANVENYGGKYQDYLMSVKKSEDDLRKEFRDGAVKRVKSAVIMRQVIEAEKIEPTDVEVRAEINHQLEHYGSDPKVAEHLKTAAYERELKGRLAVRMVMDKLKEWNIEGYKHHQH